MAAAQIFSLSDFLALVYEIAEIRHRILLRAGVRAPPARVAQAYLELAVLVRALEGRRQI